MNQLWFVFTWISSSEKSLLMRNVNRIEFENLFDDGCTCSWYTLPNEMVERG